MNLKICHNINGNVTFFVPLDLETCSDEDITNAYTIITIKCLFFGMENASIIHLSAYHFSAWMFPLDFSCR